MLDLDKPLTARAFIFLSVAFAVEYALLGMMEDAPFYFKFMTFICGTVLLFIMWKEELIRWISNVVFYVLMSLTLGVWLYFGLSAYWHFKHKQEILAGLEKIYIDSGELTRRSISGVTNRITTPSDEDVKKYHRDFKNWEQSSSQWIKGNIGESAMERYLDPAGNPLLMYAQGSNYTYNDEYNQIRHRLEEERRNLSAIMESKLYVE